MLFRSLVTSGKVRYIGISDTPAWKCAQAQSLAHFRDYAPVIALQIEYSLVERTVENELMPMARELGMGVTPWSPLKGGVLTGKYTRANMDTIEPGRGDWVKNNLTGRNLDIVEALIRVADQVDATPPQVALAWVQERQGVASTIIGARTMGQLTDNLKALDLTLSREHTNALDDASAIPPTFPQSFLPFVRNNVQGGTTVNGTPSEPWYLAPQSDDERW